MRLLCLFPLIYLPFFFVPRHQHDGREFSFSIPETSSGDQLCCCVSASTMFCSLMHLICTNLNRNSGCKQEPLIILKLKRKYPQQPEAAI